MTLVIKKQFDKRKVGTEIANLSESVEKALIKRGLIGEEKKVKEKKVK